MPELKMPASMRIQRRRKKTDTVTDLSADALTLINLY